MERILSFILTVVVGVFWIFALIIASAITLVMQVCFLIYQAIVYRHPVRLMAYNKLM